VPLYPDREDSALLALISGALHPFEGEVTNQEIDSLLGSEHTLSAEGRSALAALGDDPFSFISDAPAKRPFASVIGADHLAAMHREASDAELSEEAKAMLEKARREVLERIRNRKDTSPE
jgi:hypothetical protein